MTKGAKQTEIASAKHETKGSKATEIASTKREDRGTLIWGCFASFITMLEDRNKLRPYFVVARNHYVRL